MKKLSFVLLVTLLLGLCSCAPKPNGAEIFDIKDPQSVYLYDNEISHFSFIQFDHASVQLAANADVSAIYDMLSNLVLTETEPEQFAGGIDVHVLCKRQNTEGTYPRNITVFGKLIHCQWNDAYYLADRDITEELKGYLTRDVGTVSSGKDLFLTDSIARITVTNAQWEEMEMTDISQAVKSLSALTLTRANTPPLEGGLQITLYLQDGSRIGITFGGNIMQVNNKAYRCDTDISQIFSQVVHPES